jgi:hypothetical protein
VKADCRKILENISGSNLWWPACSGDINLIDFNIAGCQEFVKGFEIALLAGKQDTLFAHILTFRILNFEEAICPIRLNPYNALKSSQITRNKKPK